MRCHPSDQISFLCRKIFGRLNMVAQATSVSASHESYLGRLARLVATIRQQNIRVQSKIHYPVKRVIKFVYIVLRLHPNGRFLSKKNETLKLRFCCSISQMCLPKFVHVVALLLFLLDTGTCDPIFSIIIQRTTIPTLKISTIRPNLDTPHGFAFCFARGEKEMDKNSFVSFNEYF